MSERSQQNWTRIKVDPAVLRQLMQRQDARPLRDMLTWLGLMGLFMGLTIFLWGSWWAALPLYAYAVLYSTGSQSREHETGHGTAFKTKAYNKFFFELTSFMVLRESFLRAKSHDTHHQHTILTDKDPEIVTPTPPNYRALVLNLFMLERSVNGLRDVFVWRLPPTRQPWGALLCQSSCDPDQCAIATKPCTARSVLQKHGRPLRPRASHFPWRAQ